MKHERGQIGYWILLILAAGVLVGLAVASALAPAPVYVHVDADRSFVFPDAESGAFVLVQPGGAYLLQDELIDGCYRLDPPVIGQRLGKATLMYFECQ